MSTSVEGARISRGASKATCGRRPNSPVTSISWVSSAGSGAQATSTASPSRAASNAWSRRSVGAGSSRTELLYSAAPGLFSFEEADKFIHTFVARGERVGAQHRPARVVVHFQVHPVHGVIAAVGGGGGDEIAAEFRPGRLWRGGGRLEDLLLRYQALGKAAVHEFVEVATTCDVVLGEFEAALQCVFEGVVVSFQVTVAAALLDRLLSLGH